MGKGVECGTWLGFHSPEMLRGQIKIWTGSQDVSLLFFLVNRYWMSEQEWMKDVSKSCFRNHLTFLDQCSHYPPASELYLSNIHTALSSFWSRTKKRRITFEGSCDTTLLDDVINGFFSMTHAAVSSAVQLRNTHTQSYITFKGVNAMH